MNFSLQGLPMPLVIVPEEPLDDEALMKFCAVNDLYRIERTNRGELRVMSPTGGGTGSRNAEITRQVGNWAREDGRGIAFDSNAGFTLPDGSMMSPGRFLAGAFAVANALGAGPGALCADLSAVRD